MGEKIKQYAKFLAALVGAVAVSFAGLLPAEWAPWIQAGIAFLTAISVLSIPNAITDRQGEHVAKTLVEAGLIDPASPIPFGDSGFRNQ